MPHKQYWTWQTEIATKAEISFCPLDVRRKNIRCLRAWFCADCQQHSSQIVRNVIDIPHKRKLPLHCAKKLNQGLHTSKTPLNVHAAPKLIWHSFSNPYRGLSLRCFTHTVYIDKLQSQFIEANWFGALHPVTKLHGASGHGFVRNVSDIPHKLCGLSMTFLVNENFPYSVLKSKLWPAHQQSTQLFFGKFVSGLW